MAGSENLLFMEELSANRRVVQEGSDGPRSCQNPPIVRADERQILDIVIHREAGSCPSSRKEWLDSVMKDDRDDDSDRGVPGENAAPKIRIRRAPKMLREVKANKKCYSPRVVSIGPFHQDKELQVTEKLKMKMTRQFILDSNFSVDDFYKRVEDNAQIARQCYEKGSTDDYDDDAFVRMMLLDGCFILQFIHCSLDVEKYKEMKMKSHDVAFVRRDLFLLENQLPFVILDTLMSLRFKEGEGMAMLHEFIEKDFGVPPSKTKDPLHLLDLLRANLLGDKEPRKWRVRGSWRSFRSATELKSKGIHFRRSRTACLKDVNFSGNYLFGILKLPQIIVDDSTKYVLLNLIAYEMSPDAPDDSGVTSYVVFMDSLIDHPRDVEELRSRNILVNFLGSDEEVAKLFNEIATDLVPNMETYAYVSGRIGKYYKVKWKTWMAQVLHDHFSSPWTAIAFMAALFAIFLSIVQTYYAISPPPDECMESICQYLRNKTT